MNFGLIGDVFSIASEIGKHAPAMMDYVPKENTDSEDSPPKRRSTFLPVIQETEFQPIQKPLLQPQISTKSKSVWKLMSYALLILLALLIFSCIEMWVKDYVATYDVSAKQEIGIRFILPIIVFFILWTCK